MITLQDVIFILKFNAEMLNSNVRINVIKASDFLRKYNLNMILHILTQCVNSLTVIIIIQKKHNSLKCAVYTAVIVYFKKLMKHLNAEKIISEMKMTLFNNCFNE